MTSAPIFHLDPQRPKDLWRVLGFPSRGAELYRALEDGLPYRVYTELTELLDLRKQDLAEIMGIAPATMRRRIKAGRFNQNESDKLYRLVQIFSAACDLFEGDFKGAQRWLTRQVKGLGGARPIDMIATSAQTDAALDLVSRLEHGVFA